MELKAGQSYSISNRNPGEYYYRVILYVVFKKLSDGSCWFTFPTGIDRCFSVNDGSASVYRARARSYATESSVTLISGDAFTLATVDTASVRNWWIAN